MISKPIASFIVNVFLISVAIVFCSMDMPEYRLSAQDDLSPSQDAQIRESLDPFQGQTRTRMGEVPMGRFPTRRNFENPRFSGGFVTGRNDMLLGIDPNEPTSRFREPPPQRDLMPSDYLLEKPAKPRQPVVSANTLAPVDAADLNAPPLRRSPGFFQRPGMLEPPTVFEEENLIRSPIEQRWFRDIGRRPGLPAPQGNTAGNEPLAGQAIAVGGSEMLENSGSHNSVSKTQVEPAPIPVDPAARKRLFEQKLEGLLLSSPGVHFLSPVQVSFNAGTVTVRGVVPNQQNKVAAGNVLLTDPAVKQVNNMISVVPLDPSQIPPPIEPK